MRICVLGDSHLAALILSWEALANTYNQIDLVFFGARGRAMEHLELKNSFLVPTDAFTKEDIKITSEGLEQINLESFDAILVYGLADLRIFSETLKGQHTEFTESYLEEICFRAITKSLLFKITLMIRSAVNCPILISPSPFPNTACTNHESWSFLAENISQKLQLGYYKGINRAFIKLKGTLLTQPEDTVTNYLFTKDEYGSGSIRLTKGFSDIHPENDFIHMNSKYGKRFLAEFLETLTTGTKKNYSVENYVSSIDDIALKLNTSSENSPFILKFTDQKIRINNSGPFYTYGFPEDQTIPHNLVAKLPQIQIEVKNCFISKFENKSNKGSSSISIKGGLYENGKIIEKANIRGRLGSDDPVLMEQLRINNAKYIPGKCIYLGWLPKHFGHILLEMISRFWILEQADLKNTNFIFHPLSLVPVTFDELLKPELVQVILSTFEISKSQLILANEDLVVEKLTIPTQLFFLGLTVDPYQLTIYEKIKAYILHAPKMSNFNKPVLNFGINRNEVNLKLYFSRSKLGMHQKKAFNEAEVEKIFQKFGFKIIFPEKLSLYQQVELLDNAKIIAGCNGSGLHMGIFLRPGSKIIELTAGKINSNQMLVSALNNIETHFICANGGNPSIGLSWELDIPHISKHLNQILE